MAAPRAHFQFQFFRKDAANRVFAAGGIGVTVYQADGVTLLDQIMYLAAVGGTTRSNPTAADALGELEFWTDWPETVVLVAAGPGIVTKTITSEILPFSGTP